MLKIELSGVDLEYGIIPSVGTNSVNLEEKTFVHKSGITLNPVKISLKQTVSLSSTMRNKRLVEEMFWG
eukprot:5293934-Prorocentrum_lima.AAC.1